MSMDPYSERFEKVSDDPSIHIKALGSFVARKPDLVKADHIVVLIDTALPFIEKYLAGNRDVETTDGLRSTFPALRDCFRAWTDRFKAQGGNLIFHKGPAWDIRIILHAGAHVEAVCWGLFPDSPEALNNLPSRPEEQSYSSEGLMMHNIEASKNVFIKARELPALWDSFIKP